MMERVSCFPNEGTPEVIPGDPVAGDIVRATSANGAISYGRYSDPPGALQPNNPGNPYFGKRPLIPKQFWGLVLQVFVAQQGGNAAGLDRLSRLLQSKRAQPIIKIVDSVATVDPDDKDGAFLRMAGILTTTNHETDGQLLMATAEFAAIMGAWS